MNKLPVGIAGQYSVAFLNSGSLIFATSIITLVPLYSVLDTVFQSTEAHIQSVCIHVDETAKQIHQFPSVMQQYLKVVEQSILENLRKAMLGLVTAIEAIILWFVDIYKSTYRCLLAFAVNTALAVITSLAAPLQEATTSMLKGVDSAADTIGALFNQPDTSLVPTSLSNWTQSMQDTQIKVNQWTNGTDQLHQWLSKPFENLKQQINTSFIIQNANTPSSHSISSSSTITYCDTTAMLENLQDTKNKVKYILNVAIGLLVGAIFLSILARLLYIRYCHRYLRRLRYKVVDCLTAPPFFTTDHVPKPLFDSHIPPSIPHDYISAQNAIQARFSDACQNPVLASIIYRSPEHIVRPPSLWRRWLLFLFQTPIFPYCLCLSLVGLVTIYSLLAVIRSPSSVLPTTMKELDTYTDQWQQTTIQNTTQQIQQNIEAQWQTTNQWICDSETMINEQLLGTIREFAIPINATLNNMIQHMSELITTTVGDTIMETPATGILDCLILNKLDSLQQGVEWLDTKSVYPIHSRTSPQHRAIQTYSTRHRKPSSIPGVHLLVVSFHVGDMRDNRTHLCRSNKFKSQRHN
ncbi:unnamed protein product [Absidia cylindrospora]